MIGKHCLIYQEFCPDFVTWGNVFTIHRGCWLEEGNKDDNYNGDDDNDGDDDDEDDDDNNGDE